MSEEYASCRICGRISTMPYHETHGGLCHICYPEYSKSVESWCDYQEDKNLRDYGRRHVERDEFGDRLNDRRFK